jgi:hypothetical protein
VTNYLDMYKVAADYWREVMPKPDIPRDDLVWLGDLAGFQVRPADFEGGMVLIHRCGAEWPIGRLGYLGNMIQGCVIPHRAEGCET